MFTHFNDCDLMDIIFGKNIADANPENKAVRRLVSANAHLMRTDIYRSEEGKTHIEIELPGFDKEAISVELDDGILTIIAAREPDEDNRTYIVRERKPTFQRNFNVGKSYTPEDFDVLYKNGVLRITLPDKMPETPNKKTIKVS